MTQSVLPCAVSGTCIPKLQFDQKLVKGFFHACWQTHHMPIPLLEIHKVYYVHCRMFPIENNSPCLTIFHFGYLCTFGNHLMVCNYSYIYVCNCRQVPILRGSKKRCFRQSICLSTGFFIDFGVGAGTNYTCDSWKTCVILRFYRHQPGKDLWKFDAPTQGLCL